MNSFLLFGAGGHAKVIVDSLFDDDADIAGIFDDHSDLVSLNGLDVYSKYEETIHPDAKMIISIGDNIIRKRLSKQVNHEFGICIHKSAIVSKFSRVDEGSVVLHGSVIQTGTKIGKHCIVNTAASVDHDVVLGDFVHVSPKVTICDGVIVKEGTHIGAGATVLPHVTIGQWCVVGAGSVITQDLPDYSVVVGVPGKVIRKVDI